MRERISRLIVTAIVAASFAWPVGTAGAQNFSNWEAGQAQKNADAVKAQVQKETDGVATSKELSADEILRLAMGAQDDSKYTLGKTDVVDITVLRHPEVSGQFVVNNEGKIQYEFIGDIKVEGLTKEDLKNVIAQSLTKFIVSPDVTVKIAGYNSKVVYVIGEVGNPGIIFMHGDTISVREALLLAGLPLLTASPKKTRLITPSESGKADQKYVNVEALLYEGDLRENFVMKPGDTLYIPPTFLAKAMRVIRPVSEPVNSAVGTGRTVYTGGF